MKHAGQVDKQRSVLFCVRTCLLTMYCNWLCCLVALVVACCWPLLQRKREDDVELYPACHNYSTRIFHALKHVVVICSTGLGKLADMELANNLMRTAVNYR